MKYKKIISQMTLSEKAAFCSGADMWHLEKNDRLKVPMLMVTDGPHGLRKQRPGDQANINNSQPATCFPCSCLTAASWDTDLLARIGKAIGAEARRENVSAVLGPGANIKRSPLCGRNFEYFSEDPLLSGELAAAWIKGVQTQGVGTSLKHFCANNQESYRHTENSVVDERALREIYLYPFEIAVKKSAPASLMCAYNKVGGLYCSENERLLADILRKEWGFKGIVMSDWGATHDRIAGIKAGLDLEMPGSMGVHDKQITDALASRSLTVEELDRNIDRILEFIFSLHQTKKTSFFPEAHNALAREAAEQSAVLLKNEDRMFPYTDRDEKILVVGALAAIPRYQGSGSSHINPFKLTSLIDALEDEKISYEYEPGYDLLKSKPDRRLIRDAALKAAEYEKVIICAGLTDQFESEGFDRTSMRMPRSHDVLIEEIAKVNKNIAVVLFAGAPVLMPWEARVRTILYMYLPGQAGGAAALNLIYGKANPCGKLPETFPQNDSDVIPSKYPGTAAKVEYRESIFVGYRYYDTAAVAVRYPFGYGLSYTSFEYTAMEVPEAAGGGMPLDVYVTVRNTGDREGSEIVQIYIGKEDSEVFRPRKELKAFGKIKLKPGESGTLKFVLDTRSFSVYDTQKKSFAIEPGEYVIYACASSTDIRLEKRATCAGTKIKADKGLRARAPWYFAPVQSGIPKEEFEAVLGSKVPDEPEPPKKGDFVPENTILEMSRNSLMAKGILKLSKPILRRVMKCKKHDNTYLMVYEGFRSAPIKNAALTSQGAVSMDLVKGVVTMLNGSFFGGLKQVREAMKKDPGTIADD